MTAMLLGSAIATVSVRPSRLSGRMRCFIARSLGIELDDARIDLEARQVDRRHAVLPSDDLRELGLVDEARA